MLVCQRCKYGDCSASKGQSRRPPSPPLLLCHHTPSAGQKGSYCIPPVLRIDSSVFSREKRTPPLTPHARVTELAEGAPTPPLLPPWSPPHLILGLMKQHWSLLSGCVSHWESNCIHKRGGYGLCLYSFLAGPEFTWRTTTCSTTHSIYKRLRFLTFSGLRFLSLRHISKISNQVFWGVGNGREFHRTDIFSAYFQKIIYESTIKLHLSWHFFRATDQQWH